MRNRPKCFCYAYLTALVATLIAVPGIAAGMTTLLFITVLPNISSLAYGLIITLFLWLVVIPVFVSPFTTAAHADAFQYSMLKSRWCLLTKRLTMLNNIFTSPTTEQKDGLTTAEASKCYMDQALNHSNPGLRWISGKEFLNLWKVLHRAQEALLQIEASAILIREALHDQLKLQKSSLRNRDELLQKLIQAVTTLDPSALPYFKVQPPSGATGQDSLTARVALQEVRRALNDFQDNNWQGLLSLRNHILRMLASIEFFTYLLVGFVILEGVPKDIFTAAIAFYLVGAIFGLFGRFYEEAKRTTYPYDYRLTMARLITIPFFSGLAGIGGPFLVWVLEVLRGHPAPGWGEIFLLDPLHLLAAAVFGLTPNLIIHSLLHKEEAYSPLGAEV